MYKIRLTDNTEFPVQFCSAGNGTLTMRIYSDLTFIEIAELFADSDKTSTIYFEYDKTTDTYCGYTVLALINGSVHGEYVIFLKSEV